MRLALGNLEQLFERRGPFSCEIQSETALTEVKRSYDHQTFLSYTLNYLSSLKKKILKIQSGGKFEKS